MLFTATKNGDQTLALWRMVQKFAFSTASQTTVVAKVLGVFHASVTLSVMWLFNSRAP